MKLRETKKAENDRWVALGRGIDAALVTNAINAIAAALVVRIIAIVKGHKAYVLSSAERRVDVEAFASVTGHVLALDYSWT